jgi:TolB-like protein/DNA-binding winged helix-turn-helix (wHTH) protein/rhodanese-related sulfurtransferase
MPLSAPAQDREARGSALETYRFGAFLLEPRRRALTMAGVPVALSARALDLLLVLIERRDEVLSKDALRTAVWRGMAVDDNNLAVQMSALRRALGDGSADGKIILTVPGRGYQFVAPIQYERPREDVPVEVPVPAVPEPARRRPALWAASALLALAAAAAAGWALLHRPPPAPRLSIAVLPFRNLGADAQQDYLADAISDDLTTDLSHIPGSTVIARTSADTFRGHPQAADAIGRTLHVRYLLEGSLRAEGTTLHVNAQLIDAATGGHLWARLFDVPRDQLGVARTDIVRNIASALDVTLTEVEAARSLHDRPHGGDAADYFLRARSVLARGNSLAAVTEAQGLLEQAVARDPDYADALAALGAVLLRKLATFEDTDEVADYARAEQVVQRAVDLAPQNPDAVTARGTLLRVGHECEQAQASYRLALSLEPDALPALTGLAACARMLGHEQEVIDDLQQAMRLDPVGPATPIRQYQIGMAYLFQGTPGAALEWLDRAGANLGAPPATALGWREWHLIYRIAALQMAGDAAGAAAQYAAYAQQWPRRTVFRLGLYDTRAMARLPGYAPYQAALQAAGMPKFGREDEDFGIATAPQPPADWGDFDPSPLTVPGAARIDTIALQRMLASPAPPLVIDVGRGAAVMPGALLLDRQKPVDEARQIDRLLAGRKIRPDQPIVIMGGSATGWDSYGVVQQLIAERFSSVLWYRGGEEAWAAAGLPAEDRRRP